VAGQNEIQKLAGESLLFATGGSGAHRLGDFGKCGAELPDSLFDRVSIK
jgi:hypothetical protein